MRVENGAFALNTAGCIEIVGANTSCATSWDAMVQCSKAACSACPAGDFAAQQACQSKAKAAGGACASYSDAAYSCVNSAYSAVADCFAADFNTRYFVYAKNICGYKSTPTCSAYLPDPAAILPDYTPASGSKQKKCTAAQITNAYNSCFGTGSTSCSDYAASNKACYTCLFSEIGDSTYGPTVGYPSGSFALNAAGCLELSGQSPCAKAYQAWRECTYQACAASCPGLTAAEETALSACEKSASTGVCSSYRTTANNCLQGLETAVYNKCFPSSFQTGLSSLGALFCGS